MLSFFLVFQLLVFLLNSDYRQALFINTSCFSFADALQETLGFDWLLLFLQAHLHNTTVVRATRILVTMLSSLPALNRFKEGLCTGSWLDGTDIMLNKTTYVVAGRFKMLYGDVNLISSQSCYLHFYFLLFASS